MTEHQNSGDHFLKGFLFGSILGLVAGILFAPRSGKELRSEIKEKGIKALEGAEEIYEEVTAVIEDIQYHAEELMKDLSKVRQKAKEIF